MDNLMKLLGKSDSDAALDKSAAPSTDPSLMGEDATGEGDDGFEAAAEECMTALQGGDAMAFGEALKHCIELTNQ